MKSFKEFLLEDDMGGTQRYIFGINHVDRRANEDILNLARTMGYEIVEGGSHIKIMNPKTGELAATVSRGGGANPYAARMALSQLAADQAKIGGFARDMTVKEIQKAMRANPKASGLRAIGAAGLAGAGAVAGGALTQGVEAVTNVLGGLLTPPDPRSRMQGEKMIGSDVGVAFDLSPEGELMGNPAGFEAVRRREKEGRSFPTMYPQDVYK